MDKQLVIFELGNELFGVEISAVESIIKMQSITVIPHSPNFVEGVTNLRGMVLPIIDLRKRFGIPIKEGNKENRIVVVSLAGVEVGMVVDGVSEVLSVPVEAIEPVSPMVTTIDSAFLIGIAEVGSRLVILLDLGKVLSVQERDDLAEKAGLCALA